MVKVTYNDITNAVVGTLTSLYYLGQPCAMMAVGRRAMSLLVDAQLIRTSTDGPLYIGRPIAEDTKLPENAIDFCDDKGKQLARLVLP